MIFALNQTNKIMKDLKTILDERFYYFYDLEINIEEFILLESIQDKLFLEINNLELIFINLNSNHILNLFILLIRNNLIIDINDFLIILKTNFYYIDIELNKILIDKIN